jgi:FkbM family methyltransferase
MQKIGEFWIPEIDAAPGKNLERSRFGFEQRAGVQIAHLEHALELVPGRAVAIDGGANVGAWTKLMSRHFRDVHSFEPNPVVFPALARNVEEWGASRVAHLYPKGLSDRHEFVSIGTKQGARTVTGRVTGKGNIECIAIDSLKLDECSLLKLDLEGYEAKALAGAADTLRRCQPWVLIENKPDLTAKLFGQTKAHKLLLSRGYELVEKIGDDEIDWLYRPVA